MIRFGDFPFTTEPPKIQMFEFGKYIVPSYSRLESPPIDTQWFPPPTDVSSINCMFMYGPDFGEVTFITAPPVIQNLLLVNANRTSCPVTCAPLTLKSSSAKM